MDFNKLVQTGGTVMFGILNAKMPRFPRASTWLGDVSEFALWATSWVGIPLGPLRLVPMYFYMRKLQVTYASIPLRDRLYIAGGAGILAGIVEAIKQLDGLKSS